MRAPLAASLLILSTLAGCSKTEPSPAEQQPAPSPAKESAAPPPNPILVDGSSTVGLINRAVLDLYASQLVTDIKLDVSGTGGGFKKFCRKQTAINGASRPITLTEEKLCEANGVAFVELPVAFDGVAVVVPRSNEWLRSLTVSQLRKLWEPAAEGTVTSWRAVAPTFPDRPIRLFGPGIDSGTFDFFTQAIVGQEGASRSDYVSSEDDNQLVEKLQAQPDGLAYFGLAYYAKNADKLRVIPIDDELPDNGKGPVEPNRETIADGTYTPLGRPVFLYVSVAESERKEVADFIQFYLRAARLVAPDVGYVALPKRIFELATERFAKKQRGSVFSGEHSSIGLTIADLLEAEIVSVHADGK